MPKAHAVVATSLIMILALSAGCKDSTSPASVTFPELPATLLSTYCVRGERLVGQTISGTLAAEDCALDDGSRFEVWRIRVAENGTYRFAASSVFDNVLDLVQLVSHTTTEATFTEVAGNDDASVGDHNALITGAALVAGVDYFLVVNGFEPTDLGAYTVSFTKP